LQYVNIDDLSIYPKI